MKAFLRKHLINMYGVFCIANVLVFSPAYAQVTKFSGTVNSKFYKVGRTTYRVQRIQEHQLYIQTIEIAFQCLGSSIWQRYDYKNGVCNVESSEFNKEDSTLRVKYFSHDLKTGDEYRCEKTAKHREFELDDKCPTF